MKFKLIEISMVVGIVLTLVVTCLADVKSTYDDLRANVLRMHILANSDSQQDQELKLKVRDALLERSDEIFGECENLQQAEESVSQNLELIQSIAEEVVAENGYTYPVTVELTNMQFEDRTYDNIVMPSGYYDTIRVTIGNAEGHNWWCVMYPTMCVSAYVENQPTNAEDYFDGETLDMLQYHEKYQLKLKCVEWLEEYILK
jgi:stage II sporulation protein R